MYKPLEAMEHCNTAILVLMKAHELYMEVIKALPDDEENFVVKNTKTQLFKIEAALSFLNPTPTEDEQLPTVTNEDRFQSYGCKSRMDIGGTD